jgi:hypothetical protein
MKIWMDAHPMAAWFLTGALLGVALLLLIFESNRDRAESGAQSYYSRF